MSVLETAAALIEGARKESYGPAEKSFQHIADLWTAYLGKHISAEDVPMMMILLKIARQQNKPDVDNLVDIAGYAGLLEKLYGKVTVI